MRRQSPPRRVRVIPGRPPRVPAGAVYVGRAVPGLRGSPFANPFKVKPHGTYELAESLVAYRELFVREDIGGPALVARARRELAGRDLCCWCPLDRDCHADLLLRIANGGPA